LSLLLRPALLELLPCWLCLLQPWCSAWLLLLPLFLLLRLLLLLLLLLLFLLGLCLSSALARTMIALLLDPSLIDRTSVICLRCC
jgi:hypothetical protein